MLYRDIENVLSKLGFGNRAGVAAWWTGKRRETAEGLHGVVAGRTIRRDIESAWQRTNLRGRRLVVLP
jgi:hypothetical protein